MLSPKLVPLTQLTLLILVFTTGGTPLAWTNNNDLYQGAVFLLLLSAVFLFAGWLHLQPKFRPSLAWFKSAESRLNHHLAGLFGVSSLAWAGHLIHVAIPSLGDST
jgi:photosystem I P700 chlorophyll a apoprotein A2